MNTRRRFMKNSSAALGLVTLPGLLFSQNESGNIKKKIVCLGGHPDDPESGCGGTLAKLRKAGNDVTIIYLTTGEAGISGKSHDAAAAIRKQEAINACKLLDAKPIFAGQIDGDTIFNNAWVYNIQQLLTAEKPDIVFTHWPLDSHKDHQVASLLTIQVWIQTTQKFSLYFLKHVREYKALFFTRQITLILQLHRNKRGKRCIAMQARIPTIFMPVADMLQ